MPKSENNETNADSLANSLSHLEEGCQSRRQDVYVGVDVFGRGCYGGGGFNCGAALEIIRLVSLSRRGITLHLSTYAKTYNSIYGRNVFLVLQPVAHTLN